MRTRRQVSLYRNVTRQAVLSHSGNLQNIHNFLLRLFHTFAHIVQSRVKAKISEVCYLTTLQLAELM
jgi:hypothetical protein